MKNKEMCFEKVRGKFVYRLIKLVNIQIDYVVDSDEERKPLDQSIVLEIGEIYDTKTVRFLYRLSLLQPELKFVVIG